MSIMQEFSSFGVILRYELDPNGGNWAHVQFENKFQVWSTAYGRYRMVYDFIFWLKCS